MAPQPKDFRPKSIAPRNEANDVAEATQPYEPVDTDYVREIAPPFVKNFTGTDPEKDFRPVPVSSDLPEPDPKGLSAPEFAPSSESLTMTDAASSATQKAIASAEKGSTQRKEKESSTPAS